MFQVDGPQPRAQPAVLDGQVLQPRVHRVPPLEVVRPPRLLQWVQPTRLPLAPAHPLQVLAPLAEPRLLQLEHVQDDQVVPRAALVEELHDRRPPVVARHAPLERREVVLVVQRVVRDAGDEQVG